MIRWSKEISPKSRHHFMNPFTRFDSFLLGCAQWIVDFIGGDYIGQRIARHLGCVTYLSMISLFLADYRITGFVLIVLCSLWALLAWFNHSHIQFILKALHRGFANPARDRVFMRVFPLFWAPLMLFPFTPFDYIECILWLLHGAVQYLAATDNPPPKKVKETKTEDASLLTPISDSI